MIDDLSANLDTGLAMGMRTVLVARQTVAPHRWVRSATELPNCSAPPGRRAICLSGHGRPRASFPPSGAFAIRGSTARSLLAPQSRQAGCLPRGVEPWGRGSGGRAGRISGRLPPAAGPSHW